MSISLKNGALPWVKIGAWLGLAFLAVSLALPTLRPLPFFPRSNPEREVIEEIEQLERALTLFRSKYGLHPPDRISFPENADRWGARTRSRLRRMWPHFHFERPQDLNHDGDVDDVHELNGAECLVFFLGGIRSGNNEPIGFSKNPAFPFEPSGTDREGPYFEFDTERFTDVDEDGFYEYADRLNCNNTPPAPYLYVLREHGDRFRSEGLAVHPVNESRNLQQPYDMEGRSIGYHIISAGWDGKYCTGGTYDTDQTNFHGDRREEADNITNFSRGRLDNF